jgi:hypothetical protein
MSSSHSANCRKIRKPLMEKKRRTRINDSLESLKKILLHNLVALPQGQRPTKLEKADILEMTVRYMIVLHKKLGIATSECVTSTTQEDVKMESSGIANTDNCPSVIYKNILNECEPFIQESVCSSASNSLVASSNKHSGYRIFLDNNRRIVKCEQNNKENENFITSTVNHQQQQQLVLRNLSQGMNGRNSQPTNHWRPW